jgi:hypothetical protein
VHWLPGDDTITLDAAFTADELDALAWWMRQRPVTPPEAA